MGTHYAVSCPDPVYVEPQAGGDVVIQWEDGTFTITDMKPLLAEEIFAPMRKYERWHNAEITSTGAISWGDGFDFAPEFFYHT